MTQAEIESTLDKLIAVTEKLAADLAPLVKATHVSFVPSERPVIENRADALVSEVRELRQFFDKSLSTSNSVPVLTSVLNPGSFQTRIAK